MTTTSTSLSALFGSVAKRASLIAALLGVTSSGFADSIDYLASNFSSAARFAGSSNQISLIDPVAPGSTVSFNLGAQIVAQGGTTVYPKTVTFAVAPGTSAGLVLSGLGQFEFLSPTSVWQTNVSCVAPQTPGNYLIKIVGNDGTNGYGGLSSGGGLAVSFSVAAPAQPTQIPTVLTVHSIPTLIYRRPTASLSASLFTTTGVPVSNKPINFTLNGANLGSATTDANGLASLTVSTDGLKVGDYTVAAGFAGDSGYLPNAGNTILGVTYIFIGYQQPINADGSSVFGGRVIPVKIRICDYYAAPVTDATAHVFFARVSTTTVGTELEATAVNFPDAGNTMRYDAAADQYIFNWDVGALTSGTYSLRVGLGEGSRGEPHGALISIKKKK